jgi:hypothetical protein
LVALNCLGDCLPANVGLALLRIEAPSDLHWLVQLPGPENAEGNAEQAAA